MGKGQLYLIDATAFCYRAFYALKGLSTSFGQPTNAIYGFINILNKILKEKKPEYLAVCFDVSRDTFRLKKFAEYKIQRPPMPDGLSSQIPLIKEIISSYGIAMYEQEGFEADDVIATLSRQAHDNGLSVVVVSSDKDILQLVDENTVIFSPYKDEGVIYDRQKVLERYGVEPKRVADIIALMGDDVDNIPGVSGIGEKTAIELIKTFGSVENLLGNLDKLKQEKLKNALSQSLDKIKLNMELALLDKGVKLDFDLEKLKMGQPDYKELFRLFKYLEFKRMLKNLPVQEEKKEIVKLNRIKDSELDGMVGADLVLYGQDSGNMAYLSGDNSFCLDSAGKKIKAMLCDPKIKKISHDLKKIKVSLARQDIALEGLYFDTMVASYLINPSKSDYGLADLAWEHLAETIEEDSADNQKALDIISRLKAKLENELQEKSLSSLFRDVEMPLVEVLADMELEGITLDLKALKELSGELEIRLGKLVEDIYGLSGCQFNINSPKQLRDILFERLKLPVVKKTKTGPSTDEEVLRNLADKHKLPALLLEYRQLTKLKNTYIDALPELVDPETKKLHASFNQTVTETGRLSSSNPNLQNIPIKTDLGGKIRQAIIASSEAGYILSCDYSQIELRILAHISGDENLIAAFKDNKDIHKATAALIYGLNEDEVTDEMRETAKRVNFGIVYGLTSYGLSRDLGINVMQAQDFIDAYFLRYPRVQEYIQEQIKKAEGNGFVTTILGRRRYIPEINNKNQGIRQFAQRQAVNTPIQGSASDLIKLAMVEIHSLIKAKKMKSRMVIQVHDELVFDVASGEAEGLAALVKDRMENVLQLHVPIRVDIKKGKNWLQMEPVSMPAK